MKQRGADSKDIEQASGMKVNLRGSQRNYKLIFAGCFVVIILIVWFLNSQNSLVLTKDSKESLHSQHIVKFSNNVVDFQRYRAICYYNAKGPQSIEELGLYVKMLKNNKQLICQHVHKLFKYIYQIRVKYTTIVISKSFMLKVKKWLNNDRKLIKAAKNQSLIFVDNLYSSESVVFNPVRANRPGVVGGKTMEYVTKIVEESKSSCDFCKYANNTAADSFGRMESKHGVIVSNTFKIERYHGLALLKTHHPLHFSQLQFIDLMNLALQWFRQTHTLASDHLYRIMYWDVLPKASASQIHPHLHLMLGDSAYYAKWNMLYKAGLVFSREHENSNYWNGVLQIHTALGLTIRFGKATLMVYLTPQKDLEVVVISERPCLDFFRLTFFTIRTFIDKLSQYALSMGFVFPKLNADLKYGEEMPMMMRLLSRGPADNSRSDVSSFDLFGTANVNKDPFKLIQKLKMNIHKRRSEKFTYAAWKDE